jgi:hypothetical protein
MEVTMSATGPTVNTIWDLTQLLQQYLATHQQIHQREPDKPYVMDDTATITAFEPVKVSVSFESEGAGYSNLGGAILLRDLLKADQSADAVSLFQDRDYSWAIDGAEKGFIEPYFVDKYNLDISGGYMDLGAPHPDTSITLLPGDIMTNYLLTGYGHIPGRRADYLISIPEAGSLNTGLLPPEGSYVKVTDNGDNTYTVAWEDLTGGGDRDFDDVVLKFEIERIPVYKGVASTVIPETATAHNTYAFQVGNAVIEAWYEYDPDTEKPTKLWFKTTALADLPEGYKFKLTGPNGEDLPNVGSNPFTLGALKAGETDIQYFAPVTGPVKLTVTAPAGIATIEKRSVVGYDTINVNFGDTHETYQIPHLDVTEKVSLTWGKYEVELPDVVNNLTGEQKFEATKVVVTVPASVSVENLTPEFTPSVEDFNIEKPEMPQEPNPDDYATPEEYEAALNEYAQKLENYYNAVATYESAKAAVDMIKTGREQSLEIEKAAIDAVNSIVKGYLVDAISALKTSFQANMKSINEQKAEYEQIVNNLKEQLANTTDEEQKQILQEQIDAYQKAVEELAQANADLGREAVEFSKEMVEEFKEAMEDLIKEFSREAEKNKELAASSLAKAQALADVKNADFYVAYGEAILYDALASGFEQGAKIATAVLESYISVDATVNADAAEALDSVDVAEVNISI